MSVVYILEEQVKDLLEQLSDCGEEIIRLQNYIKELENERIQQDESSDKMIDVSYSFSIYNPSDWITNRYSLSDL